MKPRLLDLFCGAGGCSVGYYRAGFAPYGIDNNPKPLGHYPFPHICMDALEAMDRLLRGDGLTFSNGETLYLVDFAAFHASPPCQFASTCTPMKYRATHKNLISPVRGRLQATRRPFVIENVPNARQWLMCPIMLCGSMFGLNIRRHRYFETHPEVFTLQMPCNHPRKGLVYVSGSTGSSKAKFHRFDFTVKERREAMGTPWMTDTELDEAIPSVYTEYIGKYLLQAVGATRGVELSPDETRKLWKDYQAGTLDKFMYGDLPLGWSQVISRAQARLTRQEIVKVLFGEIEGLLDMTDDEFGFISISNHCPYSAFQSLKEKWLK